MAGGRSTPTCKLTRPELLRRLKEAGKAKGASGLRAGELLALCKRYKLVGNACLMQLDTPILRSVQTNLARSCFYKTYLAAVTSCDGGVKHCRTCSTYTCRP